jgi:carboxylesterase
VKVDASAFELGEIGGSGPALLCLHGLTGTPYEARPPLELIERLGFACLGPMLPGHDSTPSDLNGTRRSAWTDAALAAYDRLAATHSRVYTLALSLGVRLALWGAAHRPVRGSLVLAAPLDLGAVVSYGVPLLCRVIESLKKVPAIIDPEARDRHPGYRRMPLRAVAELLSLQAELKPKLASVRAPVRLLYSRLDPTVRPHNAELIRGAVGSRDASIEYLTRSGHVITCDVERERVAAWIVHSLEEFEKASVDGRDGGVLESFHNDVPQASE